MFTMLHYLLSGGVCDAACRVNAILHALVYPALHYHPGPIGARR